MLKNLILFCFLLVYIFIEILFRDYAIQLLGTLHLLQYEIETFELIGRSVSALGFTIFFSNFIKVEHVHKALLFLAYPFLFLFFYFVLHLVMENIHFFANKEMKENAYYVNLFKEGSYYMPKIEKELPFSLENKDSVGFKTFYGVSPYLYSNNDTIVKHVKHFEDYYINEITKHYFNDDELNEAIKFASFPANKIHEGFFSILTATYQAEEDIEDFYTNFFAFKRSVILFQYTGLGKRKLKDFNFKEFEQNKKNEAIFNAIESLRLKADHRFGINPAKDKLFFDNHEDDIKRIFSLYDKIHFNDSNVIWINALNLSKDKIPFDVFEGDYYMESFDRKSINQFFNTGIKSNLKDEFYSGIKATFPEITDNEMNRLFSVYVNGNFESFIRSSQFRLVYHKHDNVLADPIHILEFVNENTLDNFDHVKELKSTWGILYLAEKEGANGYIDHIKEELLDFYKASLKQSKDNYKIHVKTIMIPPFVLLLSNIALFLNISLLFTKIIFTFIKGEKYFITTQCATFFLLIVLLGSNESLDSNRYVNFFDEYAKDTLNIPSQKVFISDWFIRKNIFIDNYMPFSNNILVDLSHLIESEKARNDYRENEDLFFSILYSYRHQYKENE